MRERFAQCLVLAALVAGGPAVPLGLAAPAFAATAGACAVWSTSLEDDSGTSNLTASACSADDNDSTAIGVQCVDKKAQLRYYPGDHQTDKIAPKSRLTVTFSVGDSSIDKPMRYDDANGVFWTTFTRRDRILTLLESGGPLDVSTLVLGTHRFRLLNSTAAIAEVLAPCGIKIDTSKVPVLPGQQTPEGQ